MEALALTDFQGTFNATRMGRPPLNVVETKVRISTSSRSRVEALVGSNKLAAFIREAIENELVRREQDESHVEDRKPSRPRIDKATVRRITAVLQPGEPQDDFVRAAIEREIRRRTRSRKREADAASSSSSPVALKDK